MSSIQLDPVTDRRLAALVAATGRPASDLLREALEVYLEDAEDARLADAVLDRVERGEEGVAALDTLEKRLGLGR
jgi:predicted DNA-binding protein